MKGKRYGQAKTVEELLIAIEKQAPKMPVPDPLEYMLRWLEKRKG